MKKNYNLTLIIAGQGRERGGTGQGRSKKCKPILALPRGAGLKSRPIPALPPLRGGENPHGAKRGGVGQSGMGQNCHPYIQRFTLSLKIVYNYLVKRSTQGQIDIYMAHNLKFQQSQQSLTHFKISKFQIYFFLILQSKFHYELYIYIYILQGHDLQSKLERFGI